MAVPEPTEVAPWYLRNITQALELNSATGQVFVRTNASVLGNVTVSNVAIGSLGNVDISGNSLPVTVESGNVTVYHGTSPWVVSGNVGVVGNIAGITGNIGAITANVTVVDGGGSITVDGNVNANITGGNVNATITGTNLDAFGRLRVSNPVTLFDSQNRYIDGQQFSTTLTGSGTRTYVQDESSFNLTVGAGSTDGVYTQSKTVQAYQPGKSLLVMNTFAMAAMQSNLVQKVGYFTEQNGIYFEQSDALYFRIKSSASGSPIIADSAYQPNWNGDTLDGSGGPNNPSGILLDPTLVQIFWCDIEWLGVGNVRCGFVINGEFIVCHTFQHANMPSNTTVYMTTATLNPRYEIYKTGGGAGGTMKQICSTVISEGGYNPSTAIGYVSNGTNVTRISSANTVTSLCSIRLNPAYPDAVVTPAQVDLLLVDVRYGQFQLIENATFTASWSNVANSVVQTAIHGNTMTDGTVVYAGLNSSRDEIEISEDIKKKLQLWRTANGTPSTLTLAVSYTAANADLLYKFGWEELTN